MILPETSEMFLLSAKRSPSPLHLLVASLFILQMFPWQVSSAVHELHVRELHVREVRNSSQENRSSLCISQGMKSWTWQQELPNNIVPYIMDENLPDIIKKRIFSAMWAWEKESCFIFTQRTDQIWYISFEGHTRDDRCCIEQVPSESHLQPVHVSACSTAMATTLIGGLLGLTPDAHNSSSMDDTSDTERRENEDESIPADSSAVAEHLSSTRCEALCGGAITPNITLNGQWRVFGRGDIQSPQHPSHYPSNLDCYWKIRAPDGYALRVKFHILDIESSSNCMYDYLDVINFNSKGSLLRKRRLCSNPVLHDINNNSAHREMELETVAVLIHFHSDDTYTESGFKLEYELLDKTRDYRDPCSVKNGGCVHVCSSDSYGRHNCSCTDGYALAPDGKNCHDVDECSVRKGVCQHRCHNTIGSFFCSCRLGFRLNYDQRTCSECVYKHNSSSGIIRSHQFPAPYQHMQNCQWTLTPWINHRLRITLNFLDVLPSEKCRSDYLKFQHTHFPYQNRLCGYHTNITFVVANSMRLRFRTKGKNVHHSGFKLSYRQVAEADLTEFDLNYISIDGTNVPYRKRRWLTV